MAPICSSFLLHGWGGGKGRGIHPEEKGGEGGGLLLYRKGCSVFLIRGRKEGKGMGKRKGSFVLLSFQLAKEGKKKKKEASCDLYLVRPKTGQKGKKRKQRRECLQTLPIWPPTQEGGILKGGEEEGGGGGGFHNLFLTPSRGRKGKKKEWKRRGKGRRPTAFFSSTD